jgi:hypothetical protein
MGRMYFFYERGKAGQENTGDNLFDGYRINIPYREIKETPWFLK